MISDCDCADGVVAAVVADEVLATDDEGDEIVDVVVAVVCDCNDCSISGDVRMLFVAAVSALMLMVVGINGGDAVVVVVVVVVADEVAVCGAITVV